MAAEEDDQAPVDALEAEVSSREEAQLEQQLPQEHHRVLLPNLLPSRQQVAVWAPV